MNELDIENEFEQADFNDAGSYSFTAQFIENLSEPVSQANAPTEKCLPNLQLDDAPNLQPFLQDSLQITEVFVPSAVVPPELTHAWLKDVEEEERRGHINELDRLNRSELPDERLLYHNITRLMMHQLAPEERLLVLRAILRVSELDQRSSLVNALLNEKTSRASKWLTSELTSDDPKRRDRADDLLSDLAGPNLSRRAAAEFFLEYMSTSDAQKAVAKTAYESIADTFSLANFLRLKMVADFSDKDDKLASLHKQLEDWLQGTQSEKHVAQRLLRLSHENSAEFSKLLDTRTNFGTQKLFDLVKTTRTDDQLWSVVNFVNTPEFEKQGRTLLSLIGSKDAGEARAAVQIYDALANGGNRSEAQDNAKFMLDMVEQVENRKTTLRVLNICDDLSTAVKFQKLYNSEHKLGAQLLFNLLDDTSTASVAHTIIHSIDEPAKIAHMAEMISSPALNKYLTMLKTSPELVSRLADSVFQGTAKVETLVTALTNPDSYKQRRIGELALRATDIPWTQLPFLLDAINTRETSAAAEALAHVANRKEIGFRTNAANVLFDMYSNKDSRVEGHYLLKKFSEDTRALKVLLSANDLVSTEQELRWLSDSMDAAVPRKGAIKLVDYLGQNPLSGRQILKELSKPENFSSTRKLLRSLSNPDTAQAALNELSTFGAEYPKFQRLASKSDLDKDATGALMFIKEAARSNSEQERRAAVEYLKLADNKTAAAMDKLLAGDQESKELGSRLLRIPNAQPEAINALAKIALSESSPRLASLMKECIFEHGPFSPQASALSALAGASGGKELLNEANSLPLEASKMVFHLARSEQSLRALLDIAKQPGGRSKLERIQHTLADPTRSEVLNQALSLISGGKKLLHVTEVVAQASPETLKTIEKSLQSPLTFISLTESIDSKNPIESMYASLLLAPGSGDGNSFAQEFFPLWQEASVNRGMVPEGLPEHLLKELADPGNENVRAFALKLLADENQQYFFDLVNSLKPASKNHSLAIEILNLIKTGRHDDTVYRRLTGLKTEEVLQSARPS